MPLQILRSYWDQLLGNFNVKTGEEKLDRMVNIWNQYQCMVTFVSPALHPTLKAVSERNGIS